MCLSVEVRPSEKHDRGECPLYPGESSVHAQNPCFPPWGLGFINAVTCLQLWGIPGSSGLWGLWVIDMFNLSELYFPHRLQETEEKRRKKGQILECF